MILVTGATGLLGHYFVELLLGNGYPVKAMIRKETDKQKFKSQANLSFVVADLSDYYSLQQAVSDVEYVVHAAGLVSFRHSVKGALYKINVEGTANLVNVLLEKKNLNRLIHISSIAAIGRDLTNKVVNEDTKWTNSGLNSEYAISKHLSELEVWRGIEEGLDAVILNPSVILGQGDWSKGSLALFEMAKTKTVYPEAVFNYIDVRDIGKFLLKALTNDACLGERYILNAGEVSFADFYKKVRNEIGIKKTANPVSLKSLKLLSKLGDFLDRFFGYEIGLNKYLYNNLKNTFQYRTQKVFSVLSAEFHTLDETIGYCLSGNVENKHRLD